MTFRIIVRLWFSSVTTGFTTIVKYHIKTNDDIVMRTMSQQNVLSPKNELLKHGLILCSIMAEEATTLV